MNPTGRSLAKGFPSWFNLRIQHPHHLWFFLHRCLILKLSAFFHQCLLSLPVSPPRVPPHGHSGGIVTPKHSCRRSRATEQHEQRGKKERRERKKVRKASQELHGDDRSPLGQLSSSPAVQEKAAQKRRCRGGGKSQALTAAQPLHLLQTHKHRSYSLAAPQSRPLMPPPRVPREAKAGGVFSYGSGYSS